MSTNNTNNNDGSNPTSTQRKTISIQGNSIPPNTEINTQTGGRSPDQPVTQVQTNTTQPLKQSGGGPEGPAIVNKQGLQASVKPPTVTAASTPGTTVGNAPAAQAVGTGTQPKEATPQQDVQNQQQDPNNIDIDKFISDSTTEVKVFDEKELAKIEKMKKLTKAIESINKTRRIIFNNSETQEFVGTKFQYTQDEDGKTVYDYLNDPEIQEHLEFIIPEGDAQDGSPVDAPVTFFWKKPTF